MVSSTKENGGTGYKFKSGLKIFVAVMLTTLESALGLSCTTDALDSPNPNDDPNKDKTTLVTTETTQISETSTSETSTSETSTSETSTSETTTTPETITTTTTSGTPTGYSGHPNICSFEDTAIYANGKKVEIDYTASPFATNFSLYDAAEFKYTGLGAYYPKDSDFKNCKIVDLESAQNITIFGGEMYGTSASDNATNSHVTFERTAFTGRTYGDYFSGCTFIAPVFTGDDYFDVDNSSVFDGNLTAGTWGGQYVYVDSTGTIRKYVEAGSVAGETNLEAEFPGNSEKIWYAGNGFDAAEIAYINILTDITDMNLSDDFFDNIPVGTEANKWNNTGIKATAEQKAKLIAKSKDLGVVETEITYVTPEKSRSYEITAEDAAILCPGNFRIY